MIPAVLVYSVALGLALLLPGRVGARGAWLGLRFFAAFAVVTVVLYLANPLLGLTVTAGAWAVVALAGLGVVHAIVRRERPSAEAWIHPVVLLPAGAALVALGHGPIDYLPVSWDEFSNWLGWSKQIFVTDRHWTPAMAVGQLGYTPGWALLMVFPDVLLGRFREVYSASLQFLMHVGVLGMAFDLLRARLTQGGVTARWSAALAWLFALGVLAVEATWRLYPTLQLIEKPQIYAIAAAILTAIAAADGPDTNRDRLAGYLGLFLAFGYLLKMAMLTVVPSAALLALVLVGGGGGWGRVALRLALGLGPLGLAAVSWRLVSPETGGCMTNPLQLLTAGDSAALARALTDGPMLAERYFGAIGAYLVAFKPWLTIIAVLGLAAAVVERSLAWVVAALAVFIAGYFGMLYLYHLFCFGYEELNSIPRFTRVPLRLVHLFGLLLPALLAARHAGALARRLPPRAIAAAPVLVAVAVVTLAAVQARAVSRSLADITTRVEQTPDLVRTIADVRRDSAALSALLRGRGMVGATTTLIDQNGDGLHANVARYYAISEVRGDPVFVFQVQPGHSWGGASANQWMATTSSLALRDLLLSRGVLWPVRLDDWIRPVLDGVVQNPGCAADLTTVFLVHIRPFPFECVPRPKG
ncbi:MAG: hypothetical protein H7840_01475 [Alphaproteobacteria bacterium]